MRKKAHRIVLPALFLLATISPARGEERTVLVGIFPAAPLVMVTDSKATGLFIDLVEHFAETYGWRVEYRHGTWKEQLLRLENGEIDLLPAVSFTEERTAVYDFSRNPVYIDSGVLFTGNRFSPNTIFDLEGKTVAAVEGSVFTKGFMDYIDSFGIHCSIVYTKDNEAVMEAIARGTVDAGVCIYSLGNELAKRYPVTITPISFSPMALKFAVPKGTNADLLAEIDSLMGAMVTDPDSFYSESFRKWTRKAERVSIPAWLYGGVIILTAAGASLAFWSALLKRQVSRRTLDLRKEIQERENAEETLKHSLEEKETLIRELYHRTKNTLQVVRSMIALGSEGHPENERFRDMAVDLDNRIQAISLVHEMLFSSRDLSKIPIGEYIRELTANVLQGFEADASRLNMEVNVEEGAVIIDMAIPIGLILNELLTNSLKHAFPDGKRGTISIALQPTDNGIISLSFTDDGIGLPPGFRFDDQETLGMRLIHNIAEYQLGGKLVIHGENGFSCRLDIPANLSPGRV